MEGWVEVEFTVTEEGDVRDAKARNSSASIFEGTAISAINRWRFDRRWWKTAGRCRCAA